MDISSYLPLFIEETRDNMQQISDHLLRLEADKNDVEALNEVFRAIHTVKGMSASMGFAELSEFVHEAENYLDLVRKKKVAVDAQMISAFLKIVDELSARVENIQRTGQPGSINQERLEDIRRVLNTSQPHDAKTPDEQYSLQINLTKNCMLSAARALLISKEVGEVADVIQVQPSAEELAELGSVTGIELLLSGDIAEVNRVLQGFPEIEDFSLGVVSSCLPEVESPTDIEVPEKTSSSPSKGSSTIRVDTEKLDQLLNLVSELVINKTSIQQAASSFPGLADGVEHLHRLTGDLQGIVMKMRMVPLEVVFKRFPRMVRDTALDLGKSVGLEIQGAETELDRTIIDDIADPLLHLLRNAVDHGIEPLELRQQLGKPSTGTITLRAYQTGNQVVIEVADDGAGLDVDKIYAKAKALGVSERDEFDLNSIIFSSGFSTAENVTDISGRGVGLDVVKRSIETLGGIIEVFTQKNQGTTFKISLPLTLAIIQGLLVRCASETYVVPLSYVRETEIVYPEDIQVVGKQQIVMLRGQVMPVINLADILGLKDYQRPQEMNLVIVRHGEREIGLIVDDLLTQQEIVIKNVSWGEPYFRCFLGSTILGDGSVVLIIDINNLLFSVNTKGGGSND